MLDAIPYPQQTRFVVYNEAVVTKPQLTHDQRIELSDRYWSGREPVAKIERIYKIPANKLFQHLLPIPAEGLCVRCGSGLELHSRSQKAFHDAVCISCGHHVITARCPCAPCKAERSETEQAKEAARRERLVEARIAWSQKYEDPDHVEWAIGQLTGPQRIFLEAVKNEFLAHPPFFRWSQIAADAGLNPHHAERWIQLFKTLGLIYEDEEERVSFNEGVHYEQIVGPRARRRN